MPKEKKQIPLENLTVKAVEKLPKTARKAFSMEVYDKAVEDVVNAKTGKFFKIDIKGKTAQKLWSPLNNRIKAYNAKADREFNLTLKMAGKEIFIVKEAKK